MSSSHSHRQSSFLATTAVSLTAIVAATGVVWYWQKIKNQESKEVKTSAKKRPITTKRETDTSNRQVPIREVQTTNDDTNNNAITEDSARGRILAPNTVTIVHGSVTGTCSKLAQDLVDALNNEIHLDRTIQVGSLEEWDWWDELLNYDDDGTSVNKSGASSQQEKLPVLLVLLPTHNGGSWPPTATCLESALQDLQNDWRIEKSPLKNKLQVAVMGMGCSDYGDDSVGKPAKEAFVTFKKLGAHVFGKKVRVGDDATGNQDRVLQAWLHHDILPGLIVDDDQDGEDDDKENANSSEPDVVDMEDMGTVMESSQQDNEDSVKSSKPREMVTATQAKALKKEGYKLIGTHSAVKLCRWTKHQLRGRGGCYKHTFYGITSYQCMEATPSLACANKCVFCWRHHKNPVGKEWKWKTDDPYFIVDEAVKTHVQMIKETKGIPGVNMERWREAHTVRHCALSLVGEPIMYPRINELLGDLHKRHISSFLVTNGQHPKAIESLIPVTQLYVSVDAPTPESLVAIDRPLFSDAWERLKESLSLLKDKGQRTVARLTVVKGWNSDEVEGYAKLIALGKVSLIEIKGVTFCGKSDASNLNMSNTPWHHEVVELCRTLKMELDRLRQRGGTDAPPEYDLACEHKHSVSVLLARVDQFAVDGPDGRRVWKTWINYPKFQELSARHVEDPSFTFSVEDYTAETPAWALFGSEEEGFDPTDTRHRKKQKYPKYTQFDERGIPTHDHNNQPLTEDERQQLKAIMDEKIKQVGCGSTVTQLKGGEKLVEDASLMFRGQVIVM
ncbi:radical SAM superfamily-domain containing protein [Nitzschia inconspicua]|uniref:Radical SAM superfamily-domain containing protein n=1 Tax=Nitzschia inconspicua TaxID=303405 RepID=A0A9K3LLZ6_9STRA|nr:radical SAM superfamily-domain containing protein [Nitzschia inconspicua]